jgi:hypothetical protein
MIQINLCIHSLTLGEEQHSTMRQVSGIVFVCMPCVGISKFNFLGYKFVNIFVFYHLYVIMVMTGCNVSGTNEYYNV